MKTEIFHEVNKRLIIQMKKRTFISLLFFFCTMYLKKKEDVKYPKQKDEQCCLINQNSSRKDFHPVSLKIGKITVNV